MRDLKGKFIEGHKPYDTKGKRPSFHGNSTSFKKGLSPWNTGVSMSEEAKEKLRKAKLGKTPWNKGKPMTEEQRKKLSDAHKGKKRPHCSGPRSPLWRGGITPINRAIRMSLEYRLWRTAVFERDNHTCVWCGTRGGKLNADHIKRFSDFPELRFAIDNGRTLCVRCHKTTDTFGYRGKTKNV